MAIAISGINEANVFLFEEFNSVCNIFDDGNKGILLPVIDFMKAKQVDHKKE